MPTTPPPDQDAPQLLGEISQGPSAFEQFLDRNQKNLVILTILMALGVAGFVIYQGFATARERSAGADLCAAKEAAELEKLIQKYPTSAASGTAHVQLAERQWTDGQRDKAIETLQKFGGEQPKHPARFAAKASLASKLRTQGKTAEATAIYQDLSDEPEAGYLQPYALIALGDIAKAADKIDEAEQHYQKAKTVLSPSAFTTAADERIARLRVKLPTEIAPPPPAPAPATPGAPNAPAPGAPGANQIVPPVGADSDADVPKLDITNPGGVGGQPAEAAPAPAPAPPPAPAPAAPSK